jgi:hypothetical protein
MEIVNAGAVMADALALPRDWMGMLNRGIVLTPVGSSNSHDVSRYIIGQGRIYMRCDDRDAGRIDPGRAVERIRRGQVMVSYGLLAELEVDTKGPGELVDSGESLDVRIRVKAPGWTRANRLTLYVTGVNVREEEILPGTNAGVKWEATWRLRKPSHYVHLVAIAQVPESPLPIGRRPNRISRRSIDFTPYVLGLSGPVFVDADGSKKFESALEYARREVSSANERPLVTRLGSYDTAVAIQTASLLRAEDPSTSSVASVRGSTRHRRTWRRRSRPIWTLGRRATQGLAIADRGEFA